MANYIVTAKIEVEAESELEAEEIVLYTDLFSSEGKMSDIVDIEVTGVTKLDA